MANFKVIIGMIFGWLTVLSRAGTDKEARITWLCRCKCGNELIVSSFRLRSGRANSCGCRRVELRDGLGIAENKLYVKYRCCANTRHILFELSRGEFISITKKSCYYCGMEPSHTIKSKNNSYTYNGIDRVDNSKGYILDNCVPCCFTCNYAKKSMNKDQFLNWIKRIYINQYRKITDKTPGTLVDELSTTIIKCFYQQEKIMNSVVSPLEALSAAKVAQELNAKRNKLIRSIDAILGFSEDTPSGKTYG